LIHCAKYLVIVRALLAIFFTWYIMGEKYKECGKCSITVLPCELPKTWSSIL
jgi:hypothetical protein